METFEVIKKLAEKQGKSLQKVAEDLNFGANYLYRLRDQNPTAEKLIALADYFNVSVDYLLGRDSIKYTQPPTEKVVVPQFVADWFEKSKDDLEYKIYNINADISEIYREKIGGVNGKLNEIQKWFDNPKNKPIETIIRMKDGYTVEKEKKFWLKEKNTGYFMTKNENGYLKLLINPYFDEETEFTKQEIDNMETGSYEQIEVEE